MKIGRLSGRVKDGKPSWIFLAVSCFVMFLTSGTIESFTVLVVVFMEYFDETNAKIGNPYTLELYDDMKFNERIDFRGSNKTRLPVKK